MLDSPLRTNEVTAGNGKFEVVICQYGKSMLRKSSQSSLRWFVGVPFWTALIFSRDTPKSWPMSGHC